MELNENDLMEKGWVVTNDGDIHTYPLDAEKAWLPQVPALEYLDLKYLKRSIGDKVNTVSGHDLLPYFEKIELAAKYDAMVVSKHQIDPDQPR